MSLAQETSSSTRERITSISESSSRGGSLKSCCASRRYGIFLGYTIGLDPNQYSVAEFPGIVEEKMQEDIRRNIDYILQKIRDNNLNLHSFYFYVLPFNDGETDKKDIMEAVLKGDVDL